MPNVPVELVLRFTVPPGVIAVPGDVSVTVTVQLIAVLTVKGELHDIVVVVVRTLTVITTLLLLLARWAASVLNVADNVCVPDPMTVGV